MIYRPVRERSPESIVKSVIDGVDHAGYDETSLTSLSTADYSCITPLVREVAGKLRDKKVSLSVSSLRAYGLGEEILDQMAQMRITGLTFAPEAGTQRMRDVVNKNITEEHVAESAERVFGRGWNRLKLYFMIGLPSEQDEDVRRHRRDRRAHAAHRAQARGQAGRGDRVGVLARAQAAHAVPVVRAGLDRRDRAQAVHAAPDASASAACASRCTTAASAPSRACCRAATAAWAT